MFPSLLTITTVLFATHYFLSVIDAAVDLTGDNYYYSSNVTEATYKFKAACNDAGGSFEEFNHPDKGVYGEQLQATVCLVGKSRARSTVFTISGTHGVEGYAGSMAQILMLRDLSTAFAADLRMVHLHMINPYGASYILKENEQNADQLKNQAMYYSLAYDNSIVQEMIDGIDLPNLGNATVQKQAFEFFEQLIAKYGPDAVNVALKTGQGKRPQGIAYFGPSKSWSSLTTDYVIDKYLQNTDNILLIDWHTAVGPYGNWTFIGVDQETEIAFKSWAPDALVAPNDVGVPTGGNLPYSRVKERTGAKRVLRGVWEAGTYPVTQQTNAVFILRLYCRFYSNLTDPFCQQIIAQIKEFFYPKQEDWKILTYNIIKDILPKVLSGFKSWSVKF